MAHDVFISYSSRDKPVADSMCAALESRKIRCWIAPRDVPAGRSWPDALIEAIGNSRVFVLILSKGSNASAQVLREVGEAMDRGIPAVPFRIDDVEPSPEMRYYIRGIHWLDAMTPPLERHLNRLADTITGLLKTEEPEPETPPAPETGEKKIPPAGKPPAFSRPYVWIGSVLIGLACCGIASGGVGVYLAARGGWGSPSGSPSPTASVTAPAPTVNSDPTTISTAQETVPVFPTIRPSETSAADTPTASGNRWEHWTQVQNFPSPGTEPTGIVRVGDFLWVMIPCSNRTYKLDLTGTLVSEIPIPKPGCGPRNIGLAWDGTSLWAPWWNTVVRFDPQTGMALSEFNADIEGRSIAWDGSSLWISDWLGNISVYDPEGNRLRRLALSVYGGITALAWVEGELWSLNEFGAVTRFDADIIERGEFSISAECGISSFHEQKTYGMYWEGENLWVADAVENRIYQCAPAG
jgi:hypothetical protein